MTSVEKGLEHLLKCSKAAASRDRGELSREDARLLLEKLDCVAFLGGGTFGAVFETGSGQAAKFIPGRRSRGLLPSGGRQEFRTHRAFARSGLASQPSLFHHFQSNATPLSAEVSVVGMPKIFGTLDDRLQARAFVRSPSEAPALGARLARLLSAALAAGLVHHDAKCNNISVSADGAEVRFIDFGRAFSERDLHWLGAAPEEADHALRLGAALDAWRLQESVSRRLERATLGRWSECQKEAFLEPLRALALRLLKSCRVVPETCQPTGAAWWEDAERFQKLKTAFSEHLRRVSLKRAAIGVGIARPFGESERKRPAS